MNSNDLDKLFIGAPVIFEHNSSWNELGYWKQSAYKDVIEKLRLPTVKEAPVRTWLAPWETMPKELKELRFMLWYNDGAITVYSKGVWVRKEYWKRVKAIQILKDFEK